MAAMPPRKTLNESASQTAGPYVHIGCVPNFVSNEGVYEQDLGSGLLFPQIVDDRIKIKGCIFDGHGALVRDALIEIWQADHNGQYHTSPGAKGWSDGWARQATHFADGSFMFDTIKPGPIITRQGADAPHLNVWIVARGINIGLSTRIYFPEDDHTHDPVLSVIETDRCNSLIAKKNGNDYQFDIYLQGENETVFFDV